MWLFSCTVLECIETDFNLHLYDWFLSFTGWHNKLNSNAKGVSLSFYVFFLLTSLKQEIATFDIECDVRRTRHNIQQRITEAADCYMTRENSYAAYLKIFVDTFMHLCSNKISQYAAVIVWLTCDWTSCEKLFNS